MAEEPRILNRYMSGVEEIQQGCCKEIAEWLEKFVVGCQNGVYTLAIKTDAVARLHQGEMPCKMNRGQRVLVRAFPNETLERIVWEESGTYVVVCRPEIYKETVLVGKSEPLSVMGFPKEDILTAEYYQEEDDG